jgi:tetrahydromethanopterin S-methyltransferase subunit B
MANTNIEGKNIGLIITIAVALILGVVLIQIIASQVVTKTALTTKSETISLAAGRLEAGGFDPAVSVATLATGLTDWRNGYSECIPTTVKLLNQSGATMTVNTDYFYTQTNGSIRIGNTVAMNSSLENSTTVSYSYCPSEYVSGWGGTVSNLIPGFFALAILLTAVFVIFYVLREQGVIIGV